MFKYILILLLLISGTSLGESRYSKYLDEYILPSVQVKTIPAYKGDKYTRGSGVAITPKVVLTANHVIDGNNLVEVRVFTSGNTTSHMCKIFATHVKKDLALCRILSEEPLENTIRIYSSNTLDNFDEVLAVGYPEGIFITTRGLYNYEMAGNLLIHTAGITHGSSGGGLFTFNEDTSRYELVGINVSGIPKVTFLSMARGYEAVLDFLKENEFSVVDGLIFEGTYDVSQHR